MSEALQSAIRPLFLGFVFALACLSETETAAVLKIQDSISHGDLETAWNLVAGALQKDPHDGGLLNLRGVVNARRNEMAAAQHDFSAAVKFAPQLIPAWQNLGRACQQLNDATCAIEAWSRVVRAKPNDSEAHSALALIYIGQRRFAESLRELDTGKINDLLLRCSDLSALGRVTEATAVAEQLAKQSDFSEADFEAMPPAINSPKQASIIVPLLEGLDSRGALTVATLQRLAIAYEQLQRPADARRILERVAKQEPYQTAHLLELARIAESTKDYEGALGYLAHARDLEPQNPRIHFLFGLVAGELNLPVEAKQSLDKALAQDPDNPAYNYAMGTVILKTRDAATAAAYFEKYVKAKPADVNGHYALGLAHFASGDYPKAKQQMEIAAVDPATEGAAEYYLGRMARLDGQMDEATRHLRKSVDLLPRFSESHTELARIALLGGDTSHARNQLDQALKLAPDSFQANQQLLVLYERTHDTRAPQQAETLKKLDEERSRRADLMLRTIEVRP